MNEIKIPKQFELFGQTIDVIWDDDGLNEEELQGRTLYRKNQIILAKTCFIDGKMKNHLPTKIEVTYLHEVIHWCLHILKYNDLSDDEKFVDTFANALHQVFKTSKYK